MESKCPCCGSEKQLPPYRDHERIWLCSGCFFRCQEEYMDKLVSAMELAMAEVEQEKATQLAAQGYIKSNYFSSVSHARKRVLEVF